MVNDKNVFEQIAELVKQGKLDQQCYPVGFTITQSGKYLVKYTQSSPKLVNAFDEVLLEFISCLLKTNKKNVRPYRSKQDQEGNDVG